LKKSYCRLSWGRKNRECEKQEKRRR